MPKKIYTAIVVETRVYAVTLAIVAESDEQAKELALRGVTDDDHCVRELGEENYIETTNKEFDSIDDDDADPVMTRAQLLEDWGTDRVDEFFAELDRV